MNPIIIICAALVLCLLISSLRRGADPLSPGRVFSIVWGISIGLTELKLSAFQHSWSGYAWVTFATGIGAFLLGVFTVYVPYLNRPLLSIEAVRARTRELGRERIVEKKFFRVIIILFLAYLAAYAIEVIIVGTVPLFSARPDLLRVTFGVFGLHLIVNAMMGIVLLSAEYLLVVPRRGVRKRIIGLVIFFSIATFFLLLQRYTFVIVGCIILAMAYYSSRIIRPRIVVPVLALFVTSLFWINLIRSARYIREYVYYTSKVSFSRDYWVFAEPYMYVSMNLENFARAVDKLDHFTYGYLTFDWVLALVGLKHWLEDYFAIDRLPFLISGYNTFTFHWLYYYDFGPIGVAVFPFVTGVAIALLYYKLRTDPDLLTLVLYACGFVVIVISFIMNPLNRLDFVSNIVLIWFVHRFLISRPATGGAS
jgi:oligosaccharide repeat unit polymerase